MFDGEITAHTLLQPVKWLIIALTTGVSCGYEHRANNNNFKPPFRQNQSIKRFLIHPFYSNLPYTFPRSFLC